MIFDVFITLASYIVTFIANLLPDGEGFPVAVHTATQTLGGYVGMLNPIFPVDTLRTVLLLLFSIELAIFGFKTAKWLFSHVPFIGGRGT